MCLNNVINRILFFFIVVAQHAQVISYTLNLNRCENDRLPVEAELSGFSSDSVIWFCFPSVVPGTYDKYDFGRFISEVKIYNRDNKEILFKRYDKNIIAVKPESYLKITYTVDDSWDDTSKENFVFEPGGTNFEKDKNFVLNHHGIFGFVYGKENLPLTIKIFKPNGFYPVTGLEDIKVGNDYDILKAKSYHELVDSPAMYALPDTTGIMIDNMKVWVGVYSPKKKISARFVSKTLQEILYAQRDYLKGKLPVNKYAFIFYFHDKYPLSGSTGALEHNNSSMYSLLESDTTEDLVQTIRDVCSHEFFHLITPLTIHSEEIGNFNYIFPKMSRHLWLYEGLTEYASHHAQLLAGIIDIDQFLEVMINKLENSINFYNDKMSFTEMSMNVLKKEYNKQYANVYEKGPLINMCLDLKLLHHSGGKYGIRDLITDLGKKYGKDKSFRDDQLFDEIAALTYPGIREFFRRHVEGSEPLPLAECLKYSGIIYKDTAYVKGITLGGFGMEYNVETARFYVSDISNLDAFGKALGLKLYDELESLNGRRFTASMLDIEMIQDYYKNTKEGDVVKLGVMRPKNKRRKKFKPVMLEAKAVKVNILRKNVLRLDENFSEEQKKVLQTWAGLSFR
jgi:predicted metalloprotease with PDZ domain